MFVQILEYEHKEEKNQSIKISYGLSFQLLTSTRWAGGRVAMVRGRVAMVRRKGGNG